MSIVYSLLIALLPLVFWWRFRNLPADRDFCPYAGPGVFKTGYLEDGHVDIKPPLIHWSYKVWLILTSPFGLTLQMKLRLLPAVMLSVALFALGQTHLLTSLVLALMLCSPTLWPQMANTEWLTVSMISFALIIGDCHATGFIQPQLIQWFLLGCLPLVNQKNLLILAVVAWALGLSLTPTVPNALALSTPCLLVLCYTLITGKFNLWRYWLIRVPAEIGRARTFNKNTIQGAKVIIPCLTLFAPFVAVMDIHSPWTIVALCVLLMMVLSKQIVPHHFILLTLPVALAARPTPLTWLAIGIVWAFRDGLCWLNPKLTYKITFPNYETRLGDAVNIEKWLMENTEPNEVIWVNGMENQIYLNAMRKPWRIEIPELLGIPEGEPPRVIVHCAESFKKFDYEKYGYETVQISNMGWFTIVKRGEK